MKAVIALSGLAGLILFGPPVLNFRHHHRPVSVIVREVARQEVQPSAPAHDQCRFEARRSLRQSLDADQLLRLLAGGGALEVVGVDGLGEVRAVARACASEEEYLNDLQLTSKMQGNALLLETHYPSWGRSSWGNRYARLDLRVEVPAGLAAEIQDGSGEMMVSGLGTVDIKDGSGGIVLTDILGDVRLEDGSGEITIRDVRGSVNVDDGSGEMALRSIGGDVRINDGSGEIEVQGVGGSLTVSDSSGSWTPGT